MVFCNESSLYGYIFDAASKALGSSSVGESVPWSPPLPNKSFSCCKARFGRLTKEELSWAAPRASASCWAQKHNSSSPSCDVLAPLL